MNRLTAGSFAGWSRWFPDSPRLSPPIYKEAEMAFYLYRGRDGFWLWFLKDVRGNTVVESCGSYVTKEACLSDLAFFQSSIQAEVFILE